MSPFLFFKTDVSIGNANIIVAFVIWPLGQLLNELSSFKYGVISNQFLNSVIGSSKVIKLPTLHDYRKRIFYA